MDTGQENLLRYFELITITGGISRKIRQAAQNNKLAALWDEAQFGTSLKHKTQASYKAKRQLEWLNVHEIHCLRPGQPNYPAMLNASVDQPAWLFVRGHPELFDRPCLAIVGSRRALSESVAVAREIAASYAQCGGCVVSGLAAGVDTAAHRGALSVSGTTAAVYGCGLDQCYPKQNQKLSLAILESGACLSEYPPYTQPQKYHFPERNRIIAGLCEATLAIEASLKSGSLITAKMALENGRDVMSVPGPIWTDRFQGSHMLIQKGAKLISGIEDVFEELASRRDGRLNPSLFAGDQTNAGKDTKVSDPTDAQILAAVSDAECSVEQVATICNLPISEAASRLTMLEINGAVRRSALGYRSTNLIAKTRWMRST